MNNWSLFSADRMTHVRIVVVSLISATLVAGIGVTARISEGTVPAPIGKTIPPMTASSAAPHTIR